MIGENNMSNKQIIHLTESNLKALIKEAVDDILDQDRLWYEYVQEEKQKCQALVDFLQKNGVKSAHITSQQTGYPLVALDTDEFREYKVGVMASNFFRSRNMYVLPDIYPATTYLRINEV